MQQILEQNNRNKQTNGVSIYKHTQETHGKNSKIYNHDIIAFRNAVLVIHKEKWRKLGEADFDDGCLKAE